MGRCTATLLAFSVLAVTWMTSTVSAQNDHEVPELYEGAWYRIAVDQESNYILGDGDGYAGGTWYYYPDANDLGTWRQWYYNGPYDPNRTGYLEYVVYIKAVDANQTTYAEIQFNWSTPEWSALDKRRPPLPYDVNQAGPEIEYMTGKSLICVDNQKIGTIEPIRTCVIHDYNPEWTSIDIRATNAYVYRGAFHYNLSKDDQMGACYDAVSDDCYTAYEEQSVAPYVWMGPGTSCADYLTVELFPAPVYRFWSAEQGTHFYTADEREKDFFLTEYPDLWEFEGIAYGGHLDNTDPDVAPVHRFWSERLGVYFYTISGKEAEKLQSQYSDVWAYEGIAFYAYPESRAPVGSMPVYRFWSDSLASHFYTISENEKNKLMSEYSEVWTYEGVAWFAYLP